MTSCYLDLTTFQQHKHATTALGSDREGQQASRVHGATYDDSIVLQWGQGKFTRIVIPLDVGQTNVTTIRSTPQLLPFQAFYCRKVELMTIRAYLFDANLVPTLTPRMVGRARMARTREFLSRTLL
jgi:hypothetical protein